jgi:t-SNARE complex subunit (syntaxin)
MVSKIQTMIRNIQVELKEIDMETKQLQANGSNVSELPIRVAQYAVLLKLFVDVVQDYKAAQEHHQSRLKERMMKQALVVNPNASPAEVEKLIEEPVFGMVFAKSSHRTEALAALDDINRKHSEVSKITESILVMRVYIATPAIIFGRFCIGSSTKLYAGQYW